MKLSFSKDQRLNPVVGNYMSVQPFTIEVEQTLEKAERMMREHHIRHLPVLDRGSLVGILSDRDVKLVESLKDVDPSQVRIDEAYTPKPYVVSSDTSLEEVCETMANQKYGCAIVRQDQKLVGIFTWVDALNAFSDILKSRSKH